MIRTLFPHPWAFTALAVEGDGHHAPTAPVDVVAPHDAMLGGTRRDDPALTASGYFPGGVWEYRARFPTPPEWADRHVVLEFEAVHRSAAVYVNGDLAAQRPSGSATFTVALDRFLRAGAETEIVVEAHAARDARWYTGGGLIRPVHLATGPQVHIPLDGVTVTTPEIDEGSALVRVSTVVRNLGSRPAVRRLRTRIVAPDGEEAGVDDCRVTVPPGDEIEVVQRMLLRSAQRWSVDSPALYRAALTLVAEGADVDECEAAFGIRTLRLDPEQGLRINEVPVKLRGACVHHDNGVIGAATFDAAERRRVAILKSAGFNAIRSAHQPMSRAMLDACDELGMLVMDELTDMWTRRKTPDDGAEHFAAWWERDLESMVRKDRNHPSVFAYSIGNEIPEAGTRSGAVWSRRLAQLARRLDPTRYVTAGVNGALLVMDGAIEIDADLLGETSLEAVDEINGFMMDLADRMDALAVSDAVTTLSEEAYGALDIAGMNYLQARYALDRDLFPHRVIVGSETFPTRIDELWALVDEHPHVIGDFTWTGWDYLGEPGIGRPRYRDDPPAPPLAAYPWLLSGAGDIDITGERRAASYYRQIVFGLRSEPFIAVRRPQTRGRVPLHAPWSWSDCIPSWTWPGADGRTVEVEVYSDAPEVELVVNGRSHGRRPAGAGACFRAVFEVPFEPGVVEAAAIRSGAAAERTRLRTAGDDRRLALTVEQAAIAADGRDLAFVAIEVVDDQRVRATDAAADVVIELDGPAVLQGFGSASPSTEESFADDRHRLFDGRALAVLRPTGAGVVTVTAHAEGLPSATAELVVTGG